MRFERFFAARLPRRAFSTRTAWRSLERGPFRSGSTSVLAQTPAYDHCNFTVLDDIHVEEIAQFRDLLMAMSYSDAQVRPLLDLEGLKQWVPGRVSGYAQLSAAVERFRTIDAFVEQLQVQCA